MHSTACPLYCCKPSSQSLLYLRHLYRIPTRPKAANCNEVSLVKGSLEESNTLSRFADKVIGSHPFIGHTARIFSDEGGVAGYTIDSAEFRRRVEKKCSINNSRAFYEFQERRDHLGTLHSQRALARVSGFSGARLFSRASRSRCLPC